MTWILRVILLAQSILAIEGYKDYSRHQIFQLSPQTDEHLQYIGRLNELDFEVDVLHAVNKVGLPSEVLIPPAHIEIFGRSLAANNITFRAAAPRIAVPSFSVKDIIERAFNIANEGTFDLYRYNSYEDQMKYLDSVASRNSSFVTAGIIGYTSEKRPIKILRIGYPTVSLGPRPAVSKPALIIEAGMHAREWIAPATALVMIHKLTTDSVYEDLLKKVDIYIIPNSNPDGYEYSRLEDRMWRQTRSGPRGPQQCYGADGNRNFPYFFGGLGTSPNECDREIYRGERPLSEPEAAALSRFLLSHKKRLRGFISLHSYGGHILYPYGYQTKTYPADVKDLIWAGNRMAAAIARVRGTKYSVGNSADALYPAAGGADDYAKSLGIKYSFTMELGPTPDQELYWTGFDLPQEQIKPAAEEAFEGIIELASIIKNGK